MYSVLCFVSSTLICIPIYGWCEKDKKSQLVNQTKWKIIESFVVLQIQLNSTSSLESSLRYANVASHCLWNSKWEVLHMRDTGAFCLSGKRAWVYHQYLINQENLRLRKVNVKQLYAFEDSFNFSSWSLWPLALLCCRNGIESVYFLSVSNLKPFFIIQWADVRKVETKKKIQSKRHHFSFDLTALDDPSLIIYIDIDYIQKNSLYWIPQSTGMDKWT